MLRVLECMFDDCGYIMFKMSVNVCSCLWLHPHSLNSYGMKSVGSVHTHKLGWQGFKDVLLVIAHLSSELVDDITKCHTVDMLRNWICSKNWLDS